MGKSVLCHLYLRTYLRVKTLKNKIMSYFKEYLGSQLDYKIYKDETKETPISKISLFPRYGEAKDRFLRECPYARVQTYGSNCWVDVETLVDLEGKIAINFSQKTTLWYPTNTTLVPTSPVFDPVSEDEGYAPTSPRFVGDGGVQADTGYSPTSPRFVGDGGVQVDTSYSPTSPTYVGYDDDETGSVRRSKRLAEKARQSL